ncbi:hypothetical protein JOC37_001420, partial [Desulfohalotomaculum tongense]|uniref:ABC transporter permease n=1 Tax=Desulforadius tongensis TaxID=1216062 RepID=UPI001957AD17
RIINENLKNEGCWQITTFFTAISCNFYLPNTIEHMNNNWNVIMTSPISIRNVFTTKLTIVAILIFTVQIFFLILYFIAGKLLGLSTQMPSETIGWILRGWFAALTISALQLGLSIRIKSFAVPIGISLCCVFIGLGMYIIKLGMFFPYSLLSIGMGVLSQEGLTTTDNIQFFVMNILFTILFSSFTIHRLKTADVTT